ncbi:C40 family peptidase [Clostridium sp. HBUAS56010]|uniref:C40 family peptidase n=1 Tax=Clostridium sp. HBUAS56010 TaxID=2571127 RepID=UPI001177FB74|nr:C40 family peptidase [Clostridium sp. HBUAS56010]
MELFGVINKPVVTLWELPGESKENPHGEEISAIADEVLYGMGLKITGDLIGGYYPAETFYGYSGFVREEEIKVLSLAEIKEYEASGLMVVDRSHGDVLSLPRVQGVRLLTLPRGAVIKAGASDPGHEGWLAAELLNGEKGYIRKEDVRRKEFSQEMLWTNVLPQKEIADEIKFRKAVVEDALKYLGTQYRWGGRSADGIDCSGLTSESYLLNGVLIFRDAKIKSGFPVHEIAKEAMMPGDLMYFPGHIAMYLGDGAYIHSTGKAGRSGVRINSLNPSAKDYRKDLAESWYASGSIF